MLNLMSRNSLSRLFVGLLVPHISFLTYFNFEYHKPKRSAYFSILYFLTTFFSFQSGAAAQPLTWHVLPVFHLNVILSASVFLSPTKTGVIPSFSNQAICTSAHCLCPLTDSGHEQVLPLKSQVTQLLFSFCSVVVICPDSRLWSSSIIQC